ncbi:hypothetical protein [Paenibacillus sp. OAS669]|uniref:hypothetical protein n=1 Tax=Paenibacillus sp. OAS669 TaxID=2663821 RepID=UPI00178A570B|nr:hypothetical protein [Paenibacillus sp. OAS669]MBE1444367.1 hypothetical protein [Paenibacillus sp. OAS669]
MNTDLAVLLFLALLSAVLYLPGYIRSRGKRRNPKVTYIEEYRNLRKDKINHSDKLCNKKSGTS